MRPAELSPTPMAPADPVASIPRATLLAAWPTVRVTNVELHTATGCDDSRTMVRACLHLGTLLPVDVRVELLPAGKDLEVRGPASSTDHQLFSVQSYSNGSFVFEGCMPAADIDAPAGYAIRVTPSLDHPSVAGSPPVVRRFLPRAQDAGRAAQHDRLLAGPRGPSHQLLEAVHATA